MSTVKETAKTYSSIVTANLTYDDYTPLKQKIETAWLEGFKEAVRVASTIVELTPQSEVIGYSHEQAMQVIAQRLREKLEA